MHFLFLHFSAAPPSISIKLQLSVQRVYPTEVRDERPQKGTPRNTFYCSTATLLVISRLLLYLWVLVLLETHILPILHVYLCQFPPCGSSLYLAFVSPESYPHIMTCLVVASEHDFFGRIFHQNRKDMNLNFLDSNYFSSGM